MLKRGADVYNGDFRGGKCPYTFRHFTPCNPPCRHPSFPRPSKTCPRLQLPGDLPWQQIKRVVALRGGTGVSLTCVLQCYRNELAATQLYTSHMHDDVTALIRSANVDKRPTACPRADIQFHPRLGR